VPPHPLAPQPSFASRNFTAMPAPSTAAPIAAGPAPRNGAPRFNSVAPVSPITPAAHPTILPEHTQSTISAPLGALSEEWPEALRLEIMQTNLKNAQVALPVHLVEPALKRGRVIFSWRYVRSWIRPVPPGVSIHDGIELELPLKVIAPLFFGQQKSVARLQRKVTLTPEIPDLFFGFPQPQSPPETPELQPEPPTPKPEPVRYTPRPADFRPADTNFYIWGDNGESPKIEEDEFKRQRTPPTDFTNRRAMPKDVVARAIELPGVAGALVALQDGLKVASRVPADLNADTLAAFLPQIFERLGQSTRELRMGALNNVNFTVGNVPWKIYRVNSVYFAAFGRAGEALPTAQLALLAAELDRKKQ
jgi:predicted regulator of Ras-like GTPase activity (Roadblock/LC7/MglB family)